MELSAEINNYMYEQLKALSLLNHKENTQYEFIDSENNGSKNHKEKEEFSIDNFKELAKFSIAITIKDLISADEIE